MSVVEGCNKSVTNEASYSSSIVDGQKTEIVSWM